MQDTCLEWLQIYKWFFDKKAKIAEAQERCEICSAKYENVFTVTRKGKDVTGNLKLFEVTKDTRNRLRAAPRMQKAFK